MTKRMLIDATHAEETRVVVLDGNRLEEFDVETAAKKQLKGNIYLAKVVRVEPSLQAAFVEYGGGRHGFLAFGEIHPDYYQIPVADRQRLMEMQEAEARAEEEADDAAAAADEAAERGGHSPASSHPAPSHPASASPAEADEPQHGAPTTLPEAPLGVHDESAIPGHAEPDHALTEPADPAYGDQAPIEAALRAEAGDAPAPLGEPDAMDAPAVPAVHAATAPDDGTPPASPVPEPAAPDGASPALAEPAALLAEGSAAAVPPSETPESAPPATDDAPPSSRTQAAAIEQDVIHGDPSLFADTMSSEMAPEAMEPALADGEFAAQPAPLAAGHRDGAEDEAREDEGREPRPPARFMRSYKIQEVIRRRQILLIQVVKEERGSKGAALTTYISLAGRFSVLMPNSPRGGGISRKITSTADRRRLKEVTSELQIPRGMGLIVRTAGANRPKAEIKRDCEYLLELWDSIRDTTMKSVAPALIHEEASLIKRAIRDNYSRDVEEVLVDGEAGWRAARDFMRMLMPAHARKVVLWNDPQPLFARQAVEAQLDAMLVPTVQLKSGGYLVINQTEALVAVDVNSGRSTRERGIEETALKTNLEAADEVARQLRLRDLAGLIVIDFIDMESRRNNAAVEKRMKDALKDDRARIQLGSISSFGLMEMSRQRLRPSLAETSFTPCPHCGGTGHVRSTETSALAVLRAIEEEGAKRRAAEICVYVAGAIALYVLNHKRVRLAEIEARYGMTVSFAADETLLPPQTRIEKLRAQVPSDLPEPAVTAIPIRAEPIDAQDDLVEEEEDEMEESGSMAGASAPVASASAALPPAAPGAEPAADGEPRKRRRRRRGGRREDGTAEPGFPASAELSAPDAPSAEPLDPALAEQPDLPLDAMASDPQPPVAGEEGGLSAAAAEEARGRRRGRRGGRRRRRDETSETVAPAEGELPDDAAAEEPSSFDAARPVYAATPYTGPTPADPFGGGVFDIYDVMEQAEARAAAPLSPPPPPVAPTPRPETEGEAGEATLPAAAPEPAPAPDMVQALPLAYAEQELLPAVEAPSSPEAAMPEAAEPEAPAPEVSAIAPDAVAPEPLAPEPTSPEPTAPEPSAPEPMPEAAVRPEPVAGPISAPTLIGVSDAATEKKRGWWRR